MKLEGQGTDRGYAMAALLVGLAVMSVLMSAALPVWRHQARREKEAELVFRGEQYARAIGLYQKKNGPGTFPPSIDVLVQQRYLRKKFKDPITDDDFSLIRAGGPMAPGQTGTVGGGGAQTPGSQQGRVGGQPTVVAGGASGRGTPGGQLQAGGGIMGVSSKSKDSSIRMYKGRTHYNEWAFLFANANARPGGPGANQPGVRPGVRGSQGPGGGIGPGGGRGDGLGPGGRPGGRGGLGQPIIRPPGR
jgi:type II secretory pathway pseudopilin PulG